MVNPKKPTFIIIGSAKCGTTALASILSSHPNCCMSRPKEISFFQDTVDYQPNPNYEKGWEWYQKTFNHYAGEPVVGEATPSYSDRSRSPNTAKRIYLFNPNMKIVYMVRDPLRRQISGWKMQYAFGKENAFPWRREDKWALKGFDYWMQMQRDVGQWNECRYEYQLAAYESFFPRENICISFLENWKVSKKIEIETIMNFLGLEPNLWRADIQEDVNRADDRKIQRPLARKICSNTVIRLASKYFPAYFRSLAREYLVHSRLKLPDPKISASIKSEFTDYVIEDAKSLLTRHGEKLDLWPETFA